MWVWREQLKQRDPIGAISEAVGWQLTQAGFIARDGQIIDASIVMAPVQHNRGEENAAIQLGEAPEGWNAAQRAQKDTDARWTKKLGKSTYGYFAAVLLAFAINHVVEKESLTLFLG